MAQTLSSTFEQTQSSLLSITEIIPNVGSAIGIFILTIGIFRIFTYSQNPQYDSIAPAIIQIFIGILFTTMPILMNIAPEPEMAEAAKKTAENSGEENSSFFMFAMFFATTIILSALFIFKIKSEENSQELKIEKLPNKVDKEEIKKIDVYTELKNIKEANNLISLIKKAEELEMKLSKKTFRYINEYLKEFIALSKKTNLEEDKKMLIEGITSVEKKIEEEIHSFQEGKNNKFKEMYAFLIRS